MSPASPPAIAPIECAPGSVTAMGPPPASSADRLVTHRRLRSCRAERWRTRQRDKRRRKPPAAGVQATSPDRQDWTGHCHAAMSPANSARWHRARLRPRSSLAARRTARSTCARIGRGRRACPLARPSDRRQHQAPCPLLGRAARWPDPSLGQPRHLPLSLTEPAASPTASLTDALMSALLLAPLCAWLAAGAY